MRAYLFGGACLALLTLSACATTPIDPAVVAAANRPITCTAGPDCDAKWSRAVGWIAQNSAWKIQTQTDNLIQTYGPGEGSNVSAAFTVSKIATGSGVYAIEMSAGCANPFGCVPDVIELKAAFVNFVSPAG